MIHSPNLYTDYRPSGVEWLGDVPTHWELVRLRNRAANVVDLTRESGADDIYLALEHVESWTGRFASAGNSTKFDGQVKRFKAGDVLFGKLRPYLAKVTCPNKGGVCVGEFLVLRPSAATLSARYLEKLLRSKRVIDAIDASTFGAKMPRADWRFIGGMSLPIPPFNEQQSIVRYLDYVDRRIRRYVDAKRKLIALLEEERQVLINQAVTRGLDHNVRLKPSGIEWLGQVPEHWEVRRLKTLGRIRYGLGQPPRESVDGLPLIRATNVQRGRIVERGLIRVDPGDVPATRDALLRRHEIIVVRSGAYTADSAIIPTAYDGAVAGYDLVVTATGCLAQFMAWSLLSTYLRDDQLITASSRAAQPHLNAEELGASILLIPPMNEQTAIAEYLDKATANIDAAISRARRQVELVQEYRTRLIADVVTGKLDVRDAAAQLPEEAEDNEPTGEGDPHQNGLAKGIYDAENGPAIAEEVRI